MSTFGAGRWGPRTRSGVRALELRSVVARLVLLAGTVVAGILVLGILLVVLSANHGNTIVSAVLDAARWLAGPFDQLFTPKDHKLEIAINWGIAAAVYLAAARLVARVLVR